MQVVLVKRVTALHLLLARFLGRRAVIPKDSRVDPAGVPQAPVVRHRIREGANPVVIDRLVRLQLYRSRQL